MIQGIKRNIAGVGCDYGRGTTLLVAITPSSGAECVSPGQDESHRDIRDDRDGTMSSWLAPSPSLLIIMDPR